MLGNKPAGIWRKIAFLTGGVSVDKRTQREAALTARRALSPEERERRSEAICRRLMALSEIQSAGTVFSYLATAEEVTLSLFHRWVWERGGTLAFPVTREGVQMDAFAPTEENAIETGRFGIRSPIPAKGRLVLPEAIDLVLVPCLAFDSAGARLGMGGGYYDRYLPRCESALRLGVAFECQRVESVAMCPHDAALDMAVTEAGIYRFVRL